VSLDQTAYPECVGYAQVIRFDPSGYCSGLWRKGLLYVERGRMALVVFGRQLLILIVIYVVEQLLESFKI